MKFGPISNAKWKVLLMRLQVLMSFVSPAVLKILTNRPYTRCLKEFMIWTKTLMMLKMSIRLPTNLTCVSSKECILLQSKHKLSPRIVLIFRARLNSACRQLATQSMLRQIRFQMFTKGTDLALTMCVDHPCPVALEVNWFHQWAPLARARVLFRWLFNTNWPPLR